MKPDEFSPAALAAAAQTLRRPAFPNETLRSQLLQAAHLLAALPVPPAEPSLVFRRPDSETVECAPVGAGLVAGRGEGCEICFPGRQELSRRHFAVRAVSDLFVLEDLGSSNGTALAGMSASVHPRELRDGDLIQAGGIVFLFVKAD